MTGTYAFLITAGALALAVWSGILVILNRPPGRALWVGLGLVELLLLGFLIWGIVAMATRETPFASLEFLLYLLGVVAILPAAGWWVREETSRAAGGVLLVACLVVPVMVVRVQQVWAGA